MSWLKSLWEREVVRMVAVGLLAAVFITAFVLVSIHGDGEPQGEEEPTPTSTSTPRVMRPGESATTPAEEDSEGDDRGASGEQVEPVEQVTTDLSYEEQDAAYSAGINGFLAWYDVDPAEAPEARTARLNGYFASTSEHRAGGLILTPDSSPADQAVEESQAPQDEDEEDQVGAYMRATLNWSEVVSASHEEVRVLLGARTSGQIGSAALGGETDEQMVISSDDAYVVTLVPEAGSWRILTIEEQ